MGCCQQKEERKDYVPDPSSKLQYDPTKEKNCFDKVVMPIYHESILNQFGTKVTKLKIDWDDLGMNRNDTW